MPARTQNIVIEQGATFSVDLPMGTARDGLTTRAYLYDRFGGALIATFSTTTCANGITTMSLTAAQTGDITAPAWTTDDDTEVKLGMWMLETVDGAAIERCWQGPAYLALSVAP